MKKTIDGEAKTVRELLDGKRYAIDYYQRVYRWEQKQVGELVDDLTGRFLDDYVPGHGRAAVAGYGHYFLGSVILSGREGKLFIVDGQQRLTTLTLLLIFLHNLQRGRADAVDVGKLINSERYGERAFNIEVAERKPLMTALLDETSFDADDADDAVRTMAQRYDDIRSSFPDDLRGDALPYFVDWLIDNVHLVAITTQSDEDASRSSRR